MEEKDYTSVDYLTKVGDSEILIKSEKPNRNKYWTNYKKLHYSRVVVEVSPETKEEWQAAANKENKSLGKFVKDIVNAYIGRQE